MGSLALGGGEGLVHGVPLREMDGRAIPLRQALDLTAEALANGQSIPVSAQELFGKPVIPNWMSKLFGCYGWIQQAKHYGVHKEVKKATIFTEENEWLRFLTDVTQRRLNNPLLFF